MHKLPISALASALLAVLSIPASAGPAAPVLPLKAHPDATQWPDLVKPDLSNCSFPAGIWTFQNGVLTASEDQNLWTQDTYGDCILDLEFKFEAGANSGVFVYNSDPKSWMPTSVEIQICDDGFKKWQEAPASWHCGAFFGHQPAAKSAVKPAGEWNRLTVTCQGSKITALLNSELVSEIDLSKWTSGTVNPDGTQIPKWLQGTPWCQLPTKGRIGLQGRHAGAGIFFRNVKVLRLDPQPQ